MTRIDGRLVRDEHRYYRGPALPVATNLSDAPLTSGVDAFTLNYGTTLRPGNATVLARTSATGFYDQCLEWVPSGPRRTRVGPIRGAPRRQRDLALRVQHSADDDRGQASTDVSTLSGGGPRRSLDRECLPRTPPLDQRLAGLNRIRRVTIDESHRLSCCTVGAGEGDRTGFPWNSCLR